MVEIVVKENNGRLRKRRKRIRLFYKFVGWSVLVGLTLKLLLYPNNIILRQLHQQQQHEKQQDYQNDKKTNPITTTTHLAVKNEEQQQQQQQQQRHEEETAISRLNSSSNGFEDGKEDDDKNHNNHIQSILNGEYDLIDVQISSSENFTFSQSNDDDNSNNYYQYSGIIASFCGPLNWTLYKQNPQLTPMYTSLISKTQNCRSSSGNNNEGMIVQVDLYDIIRRVKEYDNNNINNTHNNIQLMDISGFIFHQSRCGSTWVCNLLQSMDTTKHRVYSEPNPPAHILIHLDPPKQQQDNQKKQPLLSSQQATILLQDVIYLMRRTNNKEEQRMYIKFQSTMSRYVSLILKAFPNVPWMFLYRDSIEVMMSYLGGDGGGGKTNKNKDYRRHSFCQGGAIRGLPPIKNPPQYIQNMLIHKHMNQLTYEGYCAANIASVTEPILDHIIDIEDDNIGNTGFVINYNKLPSKLYDQWQKTDWNLSIGTAEMDRMNLISNQYSKQLRTTTSFANGGGGKIFENDSSTKNVQSWDKVKEAAAIFLQETYDKLEEVASS